MERDADGFIVLKAIPDGPFDRFKKSKLKHIDDNSSSANTEPEVVVKNNPNGPGLDTNFVTAFPNKAHTNFASKEKVLKRKRRRRNENSTIVGKIDVATLRPLSKPVHSARTKLKNPMERMLMRSEVVLAIKEAAKDKMRRGDVKNALTHTNEYADNLIEKIKAGKWKPPKHKTIVVNEGSSKKVREITKPFWDNEQVVHHMVIRQFKTLVLKQLDENIFGSIPKRGTHLATKRMKKWVHKYGRKKFYVAELDIRKFFDNIDHDILKQLFRWYITDKDFLALLDKIVDSYTSDKTGQRMVGLPLGNYTSPWFANFYLLQMDQLILQDIPEIDHYLRYMDNIYLFSTNKRKLHQAKDIISIWLGLNRNLEIKDNWQIYRFEYKIPDPKDPRRTIIKGRAINSLGFVIHCDRVTVRKSILKRSRRMALKMKKVKGHKYTYHQATSMASRLGYVLNNDAHKYYHNYIRPGAPAKVVKARVSEIAKEQKKLETMYNEDVAKAFTVGYSNKELLEKKILIPHPEIDGVIILNPTLLMKGVKGII